MSFLFGGGESKPQVIQVAAPPRRLQPAQLAATESSLSAPPTFAEAGRNLKDNSKKRKFVPTNNIRTSPSGVTDDDTTVFRKQLLGE